MLIAPPCVCSKHRKSVERETALPCLDAPEGRMESGKDTEKMDRVSGLCAGMIPRFTEYPTFFPNTHKALGPTLSTCHGYFSSAVKRHHDQGSLQKSLEGFTLVEG